MKRKHIESVLLFLIPFLVVSYLGVIEYNLLWGGDYFTHKQIEPNTLIFAQNGLNFYPALLHYGKFLVPWAYINGMSVGFLFFGAFWLFGRWATVGIPLFSKAGYMILFSGAAPMFFAIGLLFLTIHLSKSNKKYSYLGILNFFFHRVIFLTSFIFLEGSLKKKALVRTLILVSGIIYLASFSAHLNYFHYPNIFALWGYMAIAIPSMFLFLGMGKNMSSLERKLGLTILIFLIIAPFSHTRAFLLIPIFGAGFILQGIKKFGKFALPVGVLIIIFNIGLEVYKWATL